MLGTGVVKLGAALNGGRCGLTEDQARQAGFEPASIVAILDDKAHYYPGASSFFLKLIADAPSHRILGVQVFGAGAVDKVVDIAVTAIYQKLKLEDLDLMDFAYAPPFSTAIHPLVTACYILENKLAGAFETFTPAQYAAGEAAGYEVIDVLPQPTIPGATWVDLAKIGADGIEGVPRDAKLLLVCAKGKRGYFAQNRLKAAGYTATARARGRHDVQRGQGAAQAGQEAPRRRDQAPEGAWGASRTSASTTCSTSASSRATASSRARSRRPWPRPPSASARARSR